jgi:predicted nucleic acid-binding protein
LGRNGKTDMEASTKLKLYLETSLISMYFQNDAPYFRDLTKLFWKNILPDFEVYISEITFEELMAIKNPQLKRQVGNLIKDIIVLQRTVDIDRITDLYLSQKKMPRADAMHLAFASLWGMNFIVTWNLRHLYKPSTQELIREVNLRLKLPIPVIVTPENFFEEEV